MIREDIFGNYPQISHTSYIDDTAILIGNIVVGENVYIGPNVVIRADEIDDNYRVGKIIIKDRAVIYDGSIINTIGASQIT
ncbi:MAG: carbonic anhydrase, partial [Caldanaerobacter sp.]